MMPARLADMIMMAIEMDRSSGVFAFSETHEQLVGSMPAENSQSVSTSGLLAWEVQGTGEHLRQQDEKATPTTSSANLRVSLSEYTDSLFPSCHEDELASSQGHFSGAIRGSSP